MSENCPISYWPLLWGEKSAVIQIGIPHPSCKDVQVRMIFPRFLSLALDFPSLIMISFGVNFFEFILLVVWSASWIYRFLFFASFEIFCPYVVEYFFSPNLSYPSWNPVILMLDIFIFSHRSQRLCSILSVYFLHIVQFREILSICPQVCWFYPLLLPLYYWAHPF